MSMEQGADYLRTHYPLPPEEDVLAGLSAMLRDFTITRSRKRTEPTRPWRFYRAAA